MTTPIQGATASGVGPVQRARTAAAGFADALRAASAGNAARQPLGPSVRLGDLLRAAEEGRLQLLGRSLAPVTPQAPAPSAAPSGAVPGPSDSSWVGRLPAAGRRWSGAIEKAANEAGVDPRLLAALVWSESGFDAGARSHAGAIGLAQLMPGTARGLGVDPTDPLENLRGGARFLSEMLDRFGNTTHALAAYNAGPVAVKRYGGVPPYAETQKYVRVVDDRYRTLQ